MIVELRKLAERFRGHALATGIGEYGYGQECAYNTAAREVDDLADEMEDDITDCELFLEQLGDA